MSQTKSKDLDYLLHLSKEKKGDTLISIYNNLSWEFKNSKLDSAFYYAREAIRLSKENGSKLQLAYGYNSLANCFENKGLLDSALVYHHKSLKLKFEANDMQGQADSYNNLGIVYDLKGDYSESLENYFKALKIYESEDVPFDKIPLVLSNIGIAYKKQKEYQKALGYYKRALAIYQKHDYSFGEVITSGNIGSVLINLKAFDSAIVYSQSAKEMYTKLGYHRYVPYMVHNIAVAKDSLYLFAEAQRSYREALSLYQKDDNLYEYASAKLGLAKSFLKEEKYKQSIVQADDALTLSMGKGFLEFEVESYRILGNAYSGLGDYKKAYGLIENYRIGNEKLFEENKTKAVFELETKYQTEKKEKEILAQRTEIAEKELDLNRKNTQLIGLVIVAILLSVLGYLVYSQQKLKNRQLQKESELKEALAKIETQNRLQEQRLRISRDLHDNIGAQLTFIISSIENLQYGLKTKNEKITNKLSGISAFTKDTIYELRDTIWAMNKSEISLEDLEARISNFVKKANLHSDITRFNFTVDEGISKSSVLSSVKGMNIYRMIQEATNNAIKYAGAENISVNVSKYEDGILVKIKDDGKGFDPKKVEHGNGLNNMKKRASDIGADFKLVSKPGSGTSVIFTIDT
ncbi:tetratricopeptide repeat-containing sensor histidine kinase [Hyunsoonleella rubra]|uniref:histidine kinase n=1 Tax=Hyunsoonleella rubra TaxID=1737062 RepID=A0ABW5T9C2_9FLAO